MTGRRKNSVPSIASGNSVFHDEKMPSQGDLPPPGRPFILPLTVAIVCVVLISLFVIVIYWDLRNLDDTLHSSVANRGKKIIGSVREVAEDNLRRLKQMPDEIDLETGADGRPSADALSPQEWMIMNLADLARKIDSEWSKKYPDAHQLTVLSEQESLWLVALFDGRGQAVSSNRSVPEDLMRLALPVIRGGEEIKINIFSRPGSGQSFRFLAMRRSSGRGTILLALDGGGFRHRSLMAAIQRAIEEVERASVSPFFIVTDQRQRVMASYGELKEMVKGWLPTSAVPKAGTPVIHREIVMKGRHLLEIISPFRVGGTWMGYARIGLSSGWVERALRKNRKRMLISLGFMAAITLLSVGFLYRNQTRHLARIRDMERRLEKAERLSALGRLAAGVAHEIRNPLNAISMAAQRLRADNLTALSEVMRDEIRRLNHIIEEFLAFSRTREMALVPHDLIQLLKQIALLMGEEAATEGIAVHTRWKESAMMIEMDVDKLKQAFLNVVKNAMESISGTGEVGISVERADRRRVRVAISDTGAGLSPEQIEKIFDLDYTTKEKGLGLGLALAHEIIKGHGGEIRVSSQEGKGTTFVILLPAYRMAGMAQHPPGRDR
jgi:signal transduction histidine kinase